MNDAAEASSAPSDPCTPVTDPLVGALLGGRYRVLRVLGQGGMGVVYEAEQTNLLRRVAIKCLHAQWARQPEIVARFEQEALAATRAKNPHVVEVFDLGQLRDGTLFIAMEFLEGQELSKVLRAGPLPVGRAVRIAMQLCDALIDVHARGIVHRDLKPDNVFLCRDGAQDDFVKVLDFGISKVARPDGAPELTNSQATLVTPTYMAPEQFGTARDVEVSADLYAVGGILYRALAGRPPFGAKDLPALIAQVLYEIPADPRLWRADLPPTLVAVVLRCLEKVPSHRPESARALREALAPFESLDEAPRLATPAPEALRLATVPAPTPATPPVLTASPAPPGRMMFLVIAVAGLVALGSLGVAALALWSRASAPVTRPTTPAPTVVTTPAPTIVTTPAPTVVTTPALAPPAAITNPSPVAAPAASASSAGASPPRARAPSQATPARALPIREATEPPRSAPVAAPPPPETPPAPSGVGLVHSAPANPF